MITPTSLNILLLTANSLYVLSRMTTTRVLMSSCWLGLTDHQYVCPLAEQVQGVARQELREDESARDQALLQLQEWISKNRDLHNCRT
ncbi:hypothetical protein J6590_093972, partial [Homalodisca vitripennis]